jgi:hypothetical protein
MKQISSITFMLNPARHLSILVFFNDYLMGIAWQDVEEAISIKRGGL